MARQVRIQFQNAVYHVMARGDRRERIIAGDRDWTMFIETFGEACAKTGWLVYAWVLMSNHYHLVLRTPQANLVAGMRWLQNTYGKRTPSLCPAFGSASSPRSQRSTVVGASKFAKHFATRVVLGLRAVSRVSLNEGRCDCNPA
jgi:putative transposase